MSIPDYYLLFLLFSFLLFTGLKLFSLWIKAPNKSTLDLTLITVIIPFRNEARFLPGILKSLEAQENLPFGLIFIDDHSEDDSIHLIESFIHTNQRGTLITLTEGKTGKKEALNFGIDSAQTPYVLTLDADVILNSNYFDALMKIPESGLTSLPVVMKGKGFLGRLFATEYTFFNAFNFLMAKMWPISISGANLLINTGFVNYGSQLAEHSHLASGDDYFLLKYFRKNNLPIYTSNDSNLTVETSVPLDLRSYFDQRVRWLSKSKFRLELMDILIGIFIFIYFVGGFIALFLALFLFNWQLALGIFILRFFMDALIYLNYAQRLRITQNVFILPFFQLIYPLLFLSVAVLSLFYSPSWKGRG